MTDKQEALREALEGYGIDTPTAIRLVHDNSQRTISKAIDNLEATPGVNSPSGYLISVIRSEAIRDKDKERGQVHKAVTCGECEDGLLAFIARSNGAERVAACHCDRGQQRQKVSYGGKSMLEYTQEMGHLRPKYPEV